MAANGAVVGERDWWRRAATVLVAPAEVFSALRDDSDDAADARQEPMLVLLFLAGVSVVLGTTIAGRLLDDPEFDALLIVLWALIGGALYALAAYFLVGVLVFLGAALAGSSGSYRRARHVLAFAAAPLALSVVVWPVRAAVFGDDLFRSGGGDTGAAASAFEALETAFLAWAVALLVVGNRAVHRWSWPRAAAATVLPAAVPALALARAWGLL